MLKRSIGQPSSTRKDSDTVNSSNCPRTPLSNISNVSNQETAITAAAERRKIRKLYLDSRKSIMNNSKAIDSNIQNVTPGASYIHEGDVRRLPLSNISNVSIRDTLQMDAAEARKQRKLYLDNRRSKTVPRTSKPQKAFPISVPMDLQNISPFTSLDANWPRTPLSNVSNQDITRMAAAEMRKKRKLYLDRRRFNISTSTSKSQNNLTPSNTYTPIASDLRNVTPGPSYIHSGLSTCFTNNASTSSNRQYYISSNLTTSTTASASLENSSLPRLSSGKRKLLSKSRIVSPIPMLDLTSDEPMARDPFKGISKDYLDHGDQRCICEVCHAKLWDYEGTRSQDVDGKKSYFLCCGYGKVELPDLKEAQINYQNLFRCLDSKSKHFMKFIRPYNSMFSFTSMGGKVDHSVNSGNAPYVFRLSGENYHTLGSLLPKEGEKPKFSQLYIYDTDNEVSNRQRLFSGSKNRSSSTSVSLDSQIITDLKAMLDSDNELVKSYRMARDCFHENPNLNLKLRLIGDREKDGRTHNLPTANEVAALIVGDIGDAIDKRDIIVETQSGSLQRISELHVSYLALQYPLLFPYGDDGYRVDIPHRGVIDLTNKKRPNCTMREFFAYRIQDRPNRFSLILNSRKLFQQFLVDAYTMIESERLNYIRHHQKNLRCESYENLCNLQNKGQQDMSNIGQRVILPSSFTGGARYMRQNYLDAMSICKWFGYPDFFITITCNPKWPEVKRFLKDTTINAEDRPDILCRLFKTKLDAIIKDLKVRALLGKVAAVVYTVEFQKRGLPHAHICLFMEATGKLPTVDHIDPFICAEIPNKNEDPELYSLVSEFMIHGPCGLANLNCPCMVDDKCSKNFPKPFRDQTSMDPDGFPMYRRRDDGSFVEKSGVRLDNRYVVPYNKKLLKRYQAHINVEWCNQAGSVKYLFKYINKGPDRTTVSFERADNQENQDPESDEIKKYYECRYISACEASWRIFMYDVHYRYPSVIRLPFHLPGQQQVVYASNEKVNNVLNKPAVSSSMFLSWMDCNKNNPAARQLTYVEFPTKFVWKADKRKWEPRIKGCSLGRIHSVSPALGEAYFLRILLNKVKGPKSFDDIKKVNGQVLPTFRDACYALGLLNDDKEYIDAIIEADQWATGFELRTLFCTMLMSNTLSIPEVVWESTWKYLSDGILRKKRKILRCPGLSLPDEQIKHLTLLEIEKFLLSNNSTLRRYPTMPYPDNEGLSVSNNRLINDELCYDITNLGKEYVSLSNSLTEEQRRVFDNIMKAVEDGKGGVFFVYGYGGTGKTFLWKTLSAAIRSKGQIAINVASSGIASLLLNGGRTAHSRFNIPLNLTEDSVCNIKPDSDVAYLLNETKLIIWDEAPMVHKYAFEALDRTLNDVFNMDTSIDSETPFGGKVIVFGGDFRQILPVVPNGGRQQIVNASLSSSYIWSKCKLLTLTKNMRLTVGADTSDMERTNDFAKWLLDLGEGNVGGINDGEATIEIPGDLLITDTSDPISSLIEFVYPSILENFNNINYFSERAILAPKNEVVHEINDRLLSVFPGEEIVYLSSDTICQTEQVNKDRFQENLYSPDVLNGLKISGLPNHRLALKVGVPVMLLRNIDQQNGLCNGTRLQVKSLGKRVIEAEIVSGGNIGTRTFIPRINMIPSDNNIPFKFQRRQFPLSVCFAMTINKSQGQSLARVGLYLKEPVFSHGQLYVALSRVKSRDGVKLLILDKEGKPTNKTTNVVYKEIFREL